MYTGDYSQEAQRGADLLDKHFASRDWRKRIDKNKFNIRESDKCTLGQLFPDHLPWDSGYDAGLDALSLNYSGEAIEGTSAFYGFTTRIDDARPNMWHILNRAWLKVLES